VRVKLSNVVEIRICVPLELGLLMLYIYMEGLKRDFWRLVLRPALEHVPA